MTTLTNKKEISENVKLIDEFFVEASSTSDVSDIRGVNDIAKCQNTSSSSFLALDVIAIRSAKNIVQFPHSLEAAFQRPGKVPLIDEFISTIK